MIRVYHRIDSDFWTPAEKFNPAEFRLVAEVATDDLERAFALTNSVQDYWWLNDGVKAIVDKTRSTSVGDVEEINGKFFAVDRCGFKEVEAA